MLTEVQSTPAGDVLYGHSELACLQADGRLRWTLELRLGRLDWTTGLRCGAQDRIYLTTKMGEVACISSDGKLEWRVRLPAKYSIASLAGIDQAGNLRVMTAIDPALHVVSSGGKLKMSTAVPGFYGAGWKTATTAPGGETYAVVSDEYHDQRQLVKLDASGQEAWRSERFPHLRAPPLVGLDGNVYLAAGSAGLLAFTPDGELAWQINTGASAPLAQGADGTVYACGADAVRAYTTDGKLKWECRQEIGTQYPAVAPDGTVFCFVTFCPPDVLAVKDELEPQELDRSYEYYLAAISPGGILKWRERLPTFTMSPLIATADGAVVVLLKDGQLLAFKE